MKFLPSFFSSQQPLVDIERPLPPLHERVHLPEGEAGTAKTIAIMQKLAANGKRNDDVRKVCGDILTGKIPGFSRQFPKDYKNYAKALYRFCRDNILYVYDPHLVEYIESPDRVLKNGIADCDSICTLLCAMFQNIGLASQFVTIKADPTRKDEFSHVYLRVMIPGMGWIACDPIMPRENFGWEAPVHFGKRYWHGSTDELGMPLDTKESLPMSGMKGLGAGEDAGFFDWLFGTSEQGEAVPTDILPGPMTQAPFQQYQPPAVYNPYQPVNPYQQPYSPTVYQHPTTQVTNCQQLVERQKMYTKAATLARKNYNECRRGKPLSLSGLGAMSKPGPNQRRPMGPTSARPVKPTRPVRPARPVAIKPARIRPAMQRPSGFAKSMAGLGCGCSPVMAGMGCGMPVMAGLGCGDTPCGPCAAKKAASGMMGLGATQIDSNIMSILDGTTLNQLLALKSDIDAQGRALDSLYASIQKIANPTDRQKAMSSYDTASRALGQTFAGFNKARSEYNTTMTKLKTYIGALPGYQSNWLPGLAGMGNLGVAVAAVVPYVAAAVAAGVISIAGSYALANIIRALHGQADTSRGYIEQTADVIRSVGGSAKDFGEGLKSAADAAVTVAQVAAVGGIGYLIYKNWKTIKDIVMVRA